MAEATDTEHTPKRYMERGLSVEPVSAARTPFLGRFAARVAWRTT